MREVLYNEKVVSKIVKLAESYADATHPCNRTISRKAFEDGYIEGLREGDLDEFQKRLSSSYSNLKIKHWELKDKFKRLTEILKNLQNGTMNISEITKDTFL